MAGYLSESDFVMVEEGFSTRDLLEELTLGASQATTAGVPSSVKLTCKALGTSPENLRL
ncbi:rCG31109, isoform CRA_b [Rattus norvegicus]|uniref:RCG31109, isoform CRA_b n=1 Tax=Rattus norvegicus TaxID=10116 RepID=A6ISG6_RAT|nr:rCG31109, isoform CRA_b [Rattus norvegicus]